MVHEERAPWSAAPLFLSPGRAELHGRDCGEAKFLSFWQPRKCREGLRRVLIQGLLPKNTTQGPLKQSPPSQIHHLPNIYLDFESISELGQNPHGLIISINTLWGTGMLY